MSEAQVRNHGENCKAISFEERIVLDVLYACQSSPIDAESQSKIVFAAMDAGQIWQPVKLLERSIDLEKVRSEIASSVIDACLRCPIDNSSRVKIIAAADGVVPVRAPAQAKPLAKVLPFVGKSNRAVRP